MTSIETGWWLIVAAAELLPSLFGHLIGNEGQYLDGPLVELGTKEQELGAI